MSDTKRVNPKTFKEEKERRHLHRKKNNLNKFDAERHQVLLGYDSLGEAVFGTDPKWLKELDDQNN